MMDDTECEDFVKLNTDKPLSLFSQKLLQPGSRKFDRNIHPTHILKSIAKYLFGYNVLSFRNLNFDVATMVVKDV